MAILTRKTLFEFASGAADIGVFGTGALGTKVLSTDPAVLQGITGSGGSAAPSAAWLAGWLNATVGANKFPPLEEINCMDFVSIYQLAYILQEGIPEYDGNTTYSGSSVVKEPGTFNLYGSLANPNVGNLLSDATKWELFGSLTNLNSSNAFQNIKITKFSGSGTWTVDANNLFTIVRAVGGGGGSAGTNGSGSPGGGSGGYLEFLLTKAQASTSQSITIGAAGAAGSSGPGNGGNGGTTSIGSLASVTGGGGTTVVPTGSSDSQWGAGGAGGAPTVSTGTDIASKAGRQGGMGGHAFSTTGGISIGGYGGGSPLGEGGSQVYAGNAPGSANVGVIGTGWGAGASGPADLSGSNTAGIAGLAGYVIMMEILA